MNEVCTWMYRAMAIRTNDATNWNPTRKLLSIRPLADRENDPFSIRAGWKDVLYIAGNIPATSEVHTAAAAPSRMTVMLSATFIEPEM